MLTAHIPSEPTSNDYRVIDDTSFFYTIVLVSQDLYLFSSLITLATYSRAVLC